MSNNKMNSLQKRADEITDVLENVYPDAVCSLNTNEPWKLLMSVRLSAQCTDKRVNIVTEKLFCEYPTISSVADARIDDISEIIKSCGLHQTKAKDLVGIAVMLRDEFNSEVPDNMEDLLRLPGVGRKTANLILGDVYSQPAVVCDTHCLRICNRLGLISTQDPVKAEYALRKLLDPKRSGPLCHRFVVFGREICTARSPSCKNCPLAYLCPGKISPPVSTLSCV